MGGVVKKVTGSLGGLFGTGRSKAARDASKAQDEANRIAQETAAQEAQNQRLMAEIQRNSQADLGGENRTVVESGGSAMEADSSDPNNKKRRPGAGGLSSVLGINA